MGARMRLLAFALAILMMLSRSCLAANREVIKVDVVKHEDSVLHGSRQLLDDDGNAEDPSSSVNNHHYIPRREFKNYQNGGDGNG
ncbi:hypothetical protein REPUB_Repub11eG0182800 [Reevesia pubescens]